MEILSTSNPAEKAPGVLTTLLEPRNARVILFSLILVGILAHFYGITQPPYGWHFYRQHDTAAIARNFYEGSLNIFYPQVDWRGDSPGYAETEFQIYTFLVALLYRVFGLHESLARGLNVVFYALSALLLFRFIGRIFDERIALYGVFFYSLMPLSFFFTRSIQPDALMALCSLAGVYYFWIWTEENRWTAFALSAVGIALAALIKLPSLYLGLPLAYLAYLKFGRRLFSKPELWIFAGAVVIPSFLWYWHAFHLWETYGNTFGLLGRHSIIGFWPLEDRRWLDLIYELMNRLIFEIAIPPAGLVFLLVGLLTRQPRRAYILLSWLLGFTVYVLLVPRGHFSHNYYQLPIVFALAAYMAYGVAVLLDRQVLTRRAVGILLLFMILVSALKLRSAFRISDDQWARIRFGERVEQLTEPQSLIIFVTPKLTWYDPAIFRHRTTQGELLYCDPIDFYHSHRKGWSLDGAQASPEFVATLHQHGAKYLATFFPGTIFTRRPHLKEALDRRYTEVELTPRWAIYRLETPRTVSY